MSDYAKNIGKTTDALAAFHEKQAKQAAQDKEDAEFFHRYDSGRRPEGLGEHVGALKAATRAWERRNPGKSTTIPGTKLVWPMQIDDGAPGSVYGYQPYAQQLDAVMKLSRPQVQKKPVQKSRKEASQDLGQALQGIDWAAQQKAPVNIEVARSRAPGANPLASMQGMIQEAAPVAAPSQPVPQLPVKPNAV